MSHKKHYHKNSNHQPSTISQLGKVVERKIETIECSALHISHHCFRRWYRFDAIQVVQAVLFFLHRDDRFISSGVDIVDVLGRSWPELTTFAIEYDKQINE